MFSGISPPEEVTEAKPSIYRDGGAWQRQQLQKAQADLLREEATMVQELIEPRCTT
jgi:hypothetical protein